MSPLPPFTPFDNRLLEALVRVGLSGAEWDFVGVVLRKTTGFRRQWYGLSLSLVAELTGRNRITLHHACQTLLRKGIISREGKPGQKATFRINPPGKWAVAVSNTLTPPIKTVSVDETVKGEDFDSAVSENTNATVSVDTNAVFHLRNKTVSVDETTKRKKERSKEKGKEKHPPSPLKGELGNTEKRVPESFLSGDVSESFHTLQRLWGHSVPLEQLEPKDREFIRRILSQSPEQLSKVLEEFSNVIRMAPPNHSDTSDAAKFVHVLRYRIRKLEAAGLRNTERYLRLAGRNGL